MRVPSLKKERLRHWVRLRRILREIDLDIDGPYSWFSQTLKVFLTREHLFDDTADDRIEKVRLRLRCVGWDYLDDGIFIHN